MGSGVNQTSQAIVPIVPHYSPRNGQQTAHLETTPPTQIRGDELVAENTFIERRPIVRREKEIARTLFRTNQRQVSNHRAGIEVREQDLVYSASTCPSNPVVFTALAETDYAAIGSLAMHGREHATVIRPGQRYPLPRAGELERTRHRADYRALPASGSGSSLWESEGGDDACFSRKTGHAAELIEEPYR